MQRLYKSCTRIPRFLWISDHCNLVPCRCNTLSAKFHNFLFTTYFPAYLMWHQANLVSIPLVPSSTSFIYITKCYDPAYINTMGDNSLSSLIVLLMGYFGGYVPPTCVWHLAVVRQVHREPSHWWSFTKAGPGPTTWTPPQLGVCIYSSLLLPSEPLWCSIYWPDTTPPPASPFLDSGTQWASAAEREADSAWKSFIENSIAKSSGKRRQRQKRKPEGAGGLHCIYFNAKSWGSGSAHGVG